MADSLAGTVYPLWACFSVKNQPVAVRSKHSERIGYSELHMISDLNTCLKQMVPITGRKNLVQDIGLTFFHLWGWDGLLLMRDFLRPIGWMCSNYGIASVWWEMTAVAGAGFMHHNMRWEVLHG